MNISRLTAPVILAGIAAGIFFPFFKIFSPFLTILLGIVIFSACLNITIGSIVETIKKPKHHLTLFLVLFLLQPLATWLIARCFIQDPLILAGLVLIAAGPTPAGLGFWIHSIKGNIPLSLAFISISHLLTPLIIPVLAYSLLGSIVTVNIISMSHSLAFTIVIPLALALLLQSFKDIKKYTQVIALPAFFLVVAAIIALNTSAIFSHPALLLLISAFVLFQCAFSTGSAFILSRSWGPREREALLLGVLGRNNILIMAIAIAGFGELAALPGAVAIVILLVIVAIYLHFKK